MAAPKRQWLSAGRCMAFALWAVEHRELADDVHAVRAAMRCTEPQAHALMRGLREARKRPARPPKARAVRRRAERAAAFDGGGMLQRLNDLDALSAALQPSAGVRRNVMFPFPVQPVGASLSRACPAMAPQWYRGPVCADLGGEPDVADYVAASVRAAELRARESKPARCFDGHRTCQHAHLGIGGQCEPGRCRVEEHDRQVAAGVEFPAYG
jgi:hypothetical protein